MIKVTVANTNGTYFTWEFMTEYDAARAVFAIALARGKYVVFKAEVTDQHTD